MTSHRAPVSFSASRERRGRKADRERSNQDKCDRSKADEPLECPLDFLPQRNQLNLRVHDLGPHLSFEAPPRGLFAHESEPAAGFRHLAASTRTCAPPFLGEVLWDSALS